jgi:GT2 family glycosyltransferase
VNAPAGFAAGWYVLRADADAEGGFQVLADRGAQPVERGFVRRGRTVTCIVHLVEPSADLRLLDAGSVPLPSRVRAIRSGMAMLWMLASLRDERGKADLRFVASALAGLARRVAPTRRRAFADRVAARYRHGATDEAAQRDAQAQLPACRIRTHALSPFARAMPVWPSGDLAPAAGGAPGAWEATGDDPQFNIGPFAPTQLLPGGWYRLRARICLEDGEINAPCLYPDYGDGLHQEMQIVLPTPGPDGWIDALVLVKYPARQLRFDPSIRRARFRLGHMSVSRLTRLGAALRMLLGMRRDGRMDSRAIAAAVGEAGRALGARDARQAGRILYRHYQASCWPDAGNYDAWVRMYDTLGPQAIEPLRRGVGAFATRPLVSILLPVYQTPERWLRRCIDSVLAQAYPHWELCIVDDASPSRRVREVLAEYGRRDPRIRVEHRATNGHISEASNSALRMARGEFVALLDHDDELRPQSLFEVVAALQRRPDARLVYSDEDKIDGQGRRFEPYFKPDWNPDLLLAQNYLCHFTVLERGLVLEAGGFRAGFEGSQDHDLFLRCTELLPAAQILHVPKVLYHWRAVPGSTALARDAKDYAATAGARAVGDHLARIGAKATVQELPHGHYRVRWPLPVPAPRVSLVVPTRDKVDLLRTCVGSILGLDRYPSLELIVVNNQSSDPEALEYLDEIAADPRVRVLRYDAPFNFSAINNHAVAQATGEVVGLVNNDIEVLSADWLEELVAHAVRADIGAVGCMLRYPDGSIQHAGVVLGVGGVANHPFQHQPRGYPGHGARALVAQNFSAVTAACLFVRRALYLQVGGLDEQLAVAFNDVDFCLRLQALGYRNLWTPFVDIVHHESASRGREDTPEKLARFEQEVQLMQARWEPLLCADPHYNPNLTLESVNFELAFPPRT